MRMALLTGFVVAMFAVAAAGQTADEIVGKYVQNIGGMERLQAVRTLRTTGKLIGGFEAVVVSEHKRPGLVRNDLTIQGLTRINAFDGKTGWKVNPFGGKKDAELMGEEELKQMVEDADIDGPLVNYAAKGNKVEFVGKEDYEGSDVYKLKVTLANGTVKYYFLDTEYYVPIKLETKQINRGTEFETETIFGDYKKVDGVYYPFSIERGLKGNPNRSSVAIEKIEVNQPIDDARFSLPKTPTVKQP